MWNMRSFAAVVIEFKLGALLFIMLGVATLKFFLCILLLALKLVIVALNYEKASSFFTGYSN